MRPAQVPRRAASCRSAPGLWLRAPRAPRLAAARRAGAIRRHRAKTRARHRGAATRCPRASKCPKRALARDLCRIYCRQSSALALPTLMAAPSNEAPATALRGGLTPAMRQYHEAKRQYRDAIVFFRMGDFYEMFFEDALVAARALDLTLTSRSKNAAGGAIPICGVPFHAWPGYLAR